ncbi:HNH endonuclease [Haladaptatus pallidirubidus]|uniref:HNH endonuclease n=1 Tax=Haladaptatus pallidirubidus TaxID=1008152 RepID=UPI001D10CCF5|nr:HNH endonuclease [Haladaptatus pallidirubidus]
MKRRANGICEGCSDPAPFTSRTGEPYLHAHHVHEVAGGGPDSPETVIALCPNCHFRVHHGRDGGVYNQKLAHQLAYIEGVPVEKILGTDEQ